MEYIITCLRGDTVIENLLSPYQWIVASEGEIRVKVPSIIISETSKILGIPETNTPRFVFTAYGDDYNDILDRIEYLFDERVDLDHIPPIRYMRITNYGNARYEKAVQSYARNIEMIVETE